jgi:hypothetical protein
MWSGGNCQNFGKNLILQFSGAYDEGCRLLRNAHKFLPVYKASHPRRQSLSIIVRAYSYIL